MSTYFFRFASTLVISASIIAAVRLARDDISRQNPRLVAVVADAVQCRQNDHRLRHEKRRMMNSNEQNT
jgi:hypothetical protein